ncbi:MAG: tRNA glutamyl-Q(34) synthetase GluQRS [Verrucomicrobiae bacterium]|nr:tRNA glutamyl-Q(34) synthetase GluQRS [Verrucomicrobiae bacterium]
MPHAKTELPPYRGRLAPSPTGYLHLGHARTFWTAFQRAQAAGGTLILRNEDLDRDRVRLEFVQAFLEDLRWLGMEWREGPDVGGPFGPYDQSARLPRYRAAFEQLRAAGCLFPCACSRRDIQSAASAPHAADEEPIYPGTCRAAASLTPGDRTARIAWRFRVPDGRGIAFEDGAAGSQRFEAGRDFGDFVVWRQDDLPSYQLACVVDDAAMGITEVVRGADLLVSTARQLLLYEALGLPPPRFHHCALLTDAAGHRLAKRHDALSLRSLRQSGRTPEELRSAFGEGSDERPGVRSK